MKIREDDIRRLEDRFGADHVHVEGRRRKGKRFDDEESPRSKNYDAKRRLQPVVPAAPVVDQTTVAKPATPEKKKEEPVSTITIVKTFADAKAVLQAQDNMEPCPVCGGLKEKQRKMDNGRTVQLLTCGSCSAAHKAHVDEATKAIVADPANAPEPMKKFQWVLSKIDLPKFRTEAETAVAEYRKKYDVTVVAVLRQRSYIEGEPTWARESHFRRPQMRFTREAFQSGIGLAVSKKLEEGLDEAYKKMRRATGRLEAATRVEPELRKALEKKAAAETPAQTAAAPIEEPPATKPPARKAAKKAAK